MATVDGRTFNFGTNDVDLSSEERRRSQKSDPVAVTHLQAVNFGDFIVAAVAVAELFSFKKKKENN